MTDPRYFLDAIDPNPYQTREHDDVLHIHGLARDIAQRGLLQVPVARAVPQADGTTRYQLAFGHSRKTAIETLEMWSRDEAMWRAQGLPAEKCNPEFWNVPPVHHTVCNCWHCGKFCGNENGPTKKEQAGGWIVRSENAGSGVFCSQAHANEYDAANVQAEKPAKKGKAKK